jgi:hypothetical protein
VTPPAQLDERSRNDLLRRVDWRFLLRRNDEPRARVPADGVLERSLALVSTSPAAGEEPDLLVLVNPRRRDLRAAAAELAPDGALYAEWRRPLLGGRRRVGRSIQAMGFEDVRWYWRWPRPGRGPQFWLPLDAPRALAFFLAPRRRAAGRGRRLLAAAWPWALRLRLLVPVCAVAQRPGAGPDAVGNAVRRHAGAGAVSWILISGGRRSVNKVVALPFADSVDRPQLVVKFARGAVEDELLRREAEVLRQLEESRPELAGVPRVLFIERRCGRLGLGETALEGEPLIWRLNRDTFDRLCTLVTEWLAGLAAPPGPTRPPAVDEPLARFADDYAAVVTHGELDRARAVLSSLPDLPVVCEQRDCAPWNVLLAGDEVSVADWESAEPDGLPTLDLVYFLTNAALHVAGALDRGPATRAYLDSLDTRTGVGRVVAACEAAYCDRLEIDLQLVPALRLLCWTIHARSEYERFEGDAAGRPSADRLATGLFLELWRAEVARRT